MAGGTGGHVFPALAVADLLRDRDVSVSWLGTERGLEADVIPKAGIDIDYINIRGLRGNGLKGWLLAPMRIVSAITQAKQIIRHRQADVVLGMGGFVTGPGGFAAWLSGVPIIIHEQNSIAGMTNKLLAHLARRVLVAFPGVFEGARGYEVVGNPLREKIFSLPSPEQRFAGRKGKLKLLVIGGSLGAKILNDVVPAALAKFDADTRPEVWHQAGKKNIDAALSAYQEAGVEGRVVPFVDDMAETYAWADVVVCRAGALTVSELAGVGLGAVLIPYPYAVDDHQTTNAKYLVDTGAAICIQQADFTVEVLFNLLLKWTEDRSQLEAMAIAAHSIARPDATSRVADICQELAHV